MDHDNTLTKLAQYLPKKDTALDIRNTARKLLNKFRSQIAPRPVNVLSTPKSDAMLKLMLNPKFLSKLQDKYRT
jgi:hypothetical protein